MTEGDEPKRLSDRGERVTVSHPPIPQLATYLQTLADLLYRQRVHDRKLAMAGRCPCVPCLAEMLAGRGWPQGTMGSGSRSSDTTSSTERAVGLVGDPDTDTHPPNAEFAGIDERLAKELRLIWQTGLRLQSTITRIFSELDPNDPKFNDPVPVGTGDCRCCEKFCRPNGNKDPENRLRAGLCPACHQARRRWMERHPDGSYWDFIRWRRQNMDGAA